MSGDAGQGDRVRLRASPLRGDDCAEFAVKNRRAAGFHPFVATPGVMRFVLEIRLSVRDPVLGRGGAELWAPEESGRLTGRAVWTFHRQYCRRKGRFLTSA